MPITSPKSKRAGREGERQVGEKTGAEKQAANKKARRGFCPGLAPSHLSLNCETDLLASLSPLHAARSLCQPLSAPSSHRLGTTVATNRAAASFSRGANAIVGKFRACHHSPGPAAQKFRGCAEFDHCVSGGRQMFVAAPRVKLCPAPAKSAPAVFRPPSALAYGARLQEAARRRISRRSCHDRHRRHRRPRKFSTAAAIRPSRSTSCSRTARWAAPPCPRALRPARTRRSNCATATRAATAARAC